MSNMTWLWVILGGGLGAGARYGVAQLFPTQYAGAAFPWATLTVNLVGCLLIGLLWGLASNHQVLNAVLIVGFLGGFTTFSSFGLDGFRLIEHRAFTSLVLYVLTSNIVGLLFVFAGTRLAQYTNLVNN